MLNNISSNRELVVAPPALEAGAEMIAADLQDEATRPEFLTKLLERPESGRIALYIPDEWLPDSPDSHYGDAYLNAWWGCLAQPDQRADFVDGDIGEQDSDDELPQVVKAAHLAPALGRAGLITASDVAYIVGGTDSALLRESFADTVRPAKPADQPILHNLPSLLRQVEVAVNDPTITPARAVWLQDSCVDTVVRDVARGLDIRAAERMMHSDGSIERQIALRSLTRHSRAGVPVGPFLPWIAAQHQHDDAQVRRQAAVSLRHLHTGGVVHEDVLKSVGVAMPRLAGELSRNLQYMSKEVALAGAVTDRICQDERLGRFFYPIVMLGGSRLKGYGDESADTDMGVVTRPDNNPDPALLKELFLDHMPVIMKAAQTPKGLYIDPVWSNFLYNSAWIGEKTAIDDLRGMVATMYDDSPVDKHVALRRLEQDTLQYRLLHKGYQRHYPIRSDDTPIPADGVDSHSVFWDPGYRHLATRLFAEKVRLPHR